MIGGRNLSIHIFKMAKKSKNDSSVRGAKQVRFYKDEEVKALKMVVNGSSMIVAQKVKDGQIAQDAAGNPVPYSATSTKTN